MYTSKIQDLITEVRNRIEKVSEEQYRVAFMYQFITGVEIAQVSGKYRPLGVDAKKITIINNSSPIELVIFKIKPNRGKGQHIFSLLPIDNSFDNWVNIVYSYFIKFKGEPPFKFHDDFENSVRYLQWKAEEVFNGLDWDFPSYTISKKGKIEAREKSFRSDALRKLRLNDLIINYNFNSLDLALFNGFNDGSRFLSHQIKDILAENLIKYSDEEIALRAIPYLTKFLKKNEDDITLDILTRTQCYFYIYTYDKLTNNDYTSKDELIENLSQLLKKDKKYVANILEQISYFDPTDEKYNEPTYYRKILLEDIFQWYWNNKEIARANFEIFLNIINTDTSLNFNSDLKDIIKENQKIFKEEGSIINLNIKLRKRSTELLNKARIYFRRQNNEGKLRCSICGYVKPNYIEREIVHIHHMEPLKDVPAEGIDILFEDAIKKMIPLCPTCHSIIHAKENNNLTIDQVIEHMQK